MPRLPFTNLLPDTKSAKHRGYKFSPSADVAGGTLVYQSSREYSRYWIERIPADLAGQAFVCRKIVKAGEEQAVHETLIADQPQNDLCSCRGFESTGRCKHIDVLRDLAANNELPEALQPYGEAELCDPDADAGETEFEDIYEDAAAIVDAGEVVARIRAELAVIDQFGDVAFRVLGESEYAEWLRNPYPIGGTTCA